MFKLYCMPKNFVPSIAVFFFLITPFTINSAELDPPHDPQGCLSCHDMVAYDQPNLIPLIVHNPLNIDDWRYNIICLNCHDGGTVIQGHYHSSLATSTKYGTWTVGCTVCHNQHTQEQDRAFGTTYGKFIQRTINLNEILDNAPPTGITMPGKSGTRTVKFIAPTGPNSFADGDDVIDGICEVCHTKTSHFRNDGSLSGVGVHTGLKGTNCLQKCHPPGQGLEPDYQCLDCHDDTLNTETNITRTNVKQQFSSNSHHVQRGDGSIENTDCHQCHWEADMNGKLTAYHGATPGSPVDLVIFESNTRPADGTYNIGTTAVAYIADGSRAQLESINDHCLGCHDDNTKGVDIFGDGLYPNYYAWDEITPSARDGSSVSARYSQLDVTTWGKYTSTTNAAKKNITKAYSAHGNVQNNLGGGWSTTPLCFGPNIVQSTCPDLGGSWDAVNGQCVSITSPQCAQNFCADIDASRCSQAAGIWGASSGMCKNITQYTCTTGFCTMGTYLLADRNACIAAGGTYRYNGTQYICVNISQIDCQTTGQWIGTIGTWKTGGKYSDGFELALNTTRGGANAKKVVCFDCHNSHGSNVPGTTTSYTSTTTNGGLLKSTTDNKGGYATSYTPAAGGTPSSHNEYNPGAALCFDCHMNESGNAAALPWGYKEQFGATQPILGYYDTPFFGYGTFPSQQRYSYKSGTVIQGGHFGASSGLTTGTMGTINGLCTPCHDPHGVSPSLIPNKQYAVPLLKDTWMTSPYKEDVAPASNAQESFLAVNAGTVYHIDQNTFASNINTIVTGVDETDIQFAGLCLKCHPKDNLTDGTPGGSWKSVDRIHESVKGWGNNPKHNYTCSKCHTPHNSRLPRLMVTNCLNTDHKGRVKKNPSPVLSGTGSDRALGFVESWDPYNMDGGSGTGHFPGTGSGNGTDNGYWISYGGNYVTGSYTYTVSCHEGETGDTYDQSWNTKTQWDGSASAPPTLTLPTAVEELDTTTWTLGATVTADGGSAVTARGTVFGTSPAPIVNAEDEGGIATGVFSHLRSDLVPATKYYYRGYATNSVGIGYTPDGSLYTEPAHQPENVDISLTATGVTLTWERNSGDGTLVVLKQGTAVDFVPSDGTFTGYTANSAFGSGTQMGVGNYIVYKGDSTNAVVTGLIPNTLYHVALYEYKGAADTLGVNRGTNFNPGPTAYNFTTLNGASLTFGYTGSVQLRTIPSGATNIQFTVKGGGGGGGRYDEWNNHTNGLNGHSAVAAYDTTGDLVGGPDQDVGVSIYVGGGGQIPTGNAGAVGGWGYPSGGSGIAGDYDNPSDDAWGGAGGGGASSIYTGATRLVEAAGGTGGKSAGWYLYEECCEGGLGGPGGGTDFPATVSTTGGGAGGLRGDPPVLGGAGQVKISYTIP